MKFKPIIETEIKLRVPSIQEARKQLRSLGFNILVKMQKEETVIWDKQGTLKETDCVLRLRQYDQKTTLTFKHAKEKHPILKIRPEAQTVVDDLQSTEQILRWLGFEPTLTMIKHREIWRRPELVACLDQTPFGSFMELEGEPDAIKLAMESLCVDASRIEYKGYPSLFRAFATSE